MVSKQLLESKPTVPTVKRAPLRTSGDSFADDDLTHTSSVTGHSRQSCRPLTSPVQTWRLRDRTPPATALMPRWAAKETRAATTSGGRPKGGKAADDDVPESLAYLPARLPTDNALRRGLAPRGPDVAVLLDGTALVACGASLPHAHHSARGPSARAPPDDDKRSLAHLLRAVLFKSTPRGGQALHPR